jgi:Fe-S oxidoreductase
MQRPGRDGGDGAVAVGELLQGLRNLYPAERLFTGRGQAHVVAAGNIGCLTQIRQYLNVPVRHTIQILDRAYAGVDAR